MSPDIPLVRVGLPSPGGALTDAARALGCPVLVSANSFIRRDEYSSIESVRVAPPSLDGLDAMLDSAGFVAMALYGEPLDPHWYVANIVRRYPWTHWASVDLCCEPAIAPHPLEILFRQAETTRLYAECCRYARLYEVPPPVPIVQGWTARDYERNAGQMSLDCAAPDLVGVGSVCRRQIHGPAGIIAIVRTLSEILPPNARLHLFGVKDETLAYVLADPELGWRIHSIDSMAWDLRARLRFPTGRTTAVRAAVMREWYLEQLAQIDTARANVQATLLRSEPRAPLDWHTGDEDLDQWLELIAANEIEMRSGWSYYQSEACYYAEPDAVRAMRREPGRPRRVPNEPDPTRIEQPQLDLLGPALAA